MTERGKRGLSLCGGGITGAMYQVGCIAAFEEGIEGFHIEDFDVFVGSSTGAVVATLFAGGISPTRLYRALLDPSDPFFPLERKHILRFDLTGWRRAAASAIGTFRHLLSNVSSRALADFGTEIDGFWDSLPAGIFELDAFEGFLDEFFERRDVPKHFAAFSRELYVVASDLDRGTRAVFGAGELRDVPVAKAICAAAAVPLLYAPYSIDGHDYIEGGSGDVAHVDIAYDRGCDVILVVNPNVAARVSADSAEVPTAQGKRRRVREKGALWVYDQAWRIRTEMRLRSGIESFVREHPGTKAVLLEPAAEDVTMFMHSPMNFAARRAILESAFTETRRAMRAPESSLRRALETAGFVLKDA